MRGHLPHVIVDDKVITIGLDDYRTLKSIEAAFSKAVLEQHPQGASAAYVQFKKNLTVRDTFALASARMGWKLLDRKGLQGKPSHQAKALAAYCNVAVRPLTRAFGEADMIKALPEAAKDQRVIDICRGLGANDLAALCIKAKNAPAV